MSRMNVGILFGGRSGEHEVSLLSAASVYRHLDRERFDTLLIGIDYDGRWYYQESPSFDKETGGLELISKKENLIHVAPGEGLFLSGEKLAVDIVFPVLHGTYGEDGTVQSLLEIAGLPYVGAGVLASALGMDKTMVKRVWMQLGLPTVEFLEIRRERFGDPDRRDELLGEIERRFSYPLFVKPARCGSSVGVSRAESRSELIAAAAAAFEYDTKLLVEPEVTGQEVECSVVGNEEARSFSVGEIVPHHSFYDYEAKYLDPDGAELRIPAALDDELREEVRELALRAYRAADTEGFARLDFFVTAEKRVLLNEINTIPGFTSISMFPKLCEASGLMYKDLISRLIELGFARFELRKSLRFTSDHRRPTD